MSDSKRTLIRNSTAEFLIFTSQAGEQSIEVPTRTISCVGRLGDLAGPLQRFLASPKQQRLEWPLDQSRRQAIHQYIDHHELHVEHKTRRSSRPFTLVLEKTRALFEHDAAERRQWKKDLAWLRRVAGHFA